MSRFLLAPLFILILVMGVAPMPVSAGALCDGLPQTTAAEIQIYQDCLVSEAGANRTATDAELDAQNQAALSTAVAADKAAAEKAKIDPVGNPGDGYTSIMTWIMKLFAWLLGLAAMTLDYAVYYTVINMGEYVHNLTAVGITWRILRDIGNIMLIFGFLAIGISTILNTERLGYGKKMLPMLLVAAVFLNFSLFFSEAIIDMGNIFATQFFTQINGGVQPSSATLANMSIGSEGISNKIMAQVGLQNMYNAGSVNTGVFKADNSWLIGFMAIILFIVAAFVFFSLAFILIARFIYLIYLIVLAPIGFAGLAVPQLKGMADGWWKSLFEQTITAPVLLLLLYIAIAVITDTSFLTGLCPPAVTAKCDLLGFTGGNYQGFASMILSFLVAMGLLIFVTIAAKHLSAFGASAVSKVSGMATSKMTNMAMAPVKFAGNTAAKGVSGSARWAVRSTAGRVLYKAGQQVRNTKVFGKDVSTTQAGRLLATALDRGGKGFKEAKEKSAKTHEEYIKSVHAAIDDRAAPAVVDAAHTRAAAVEGPRKIIKEEKESLKDLAEIRKTLNKEMEELEKRVKNNVHEGVDTPEARATKVAFEEAKRKVTANQDAQSAANRRVSDAEKAVAAALKEEEEVTKVVTKQKKEASIAYAENLQTGFRANPFTWAASGKGGDAAAMKILKDMFKDSTDETKALETLKKVITPETTATATGTPPAAPTAPAAPAGGGHP